MCRQSSVQFSPSSLFSSFGHAEAFGLLASECTQDEIFIALNFINEYVRDLRVDEENETKIIVLARCCALEKLKITYSPCQINQNIFRKYIIKKEQPKKRVGTPSTEHTELN